MALTNSLRRTMLLGTAVGLLISGLVAAPARARVQSGDTYLCRSSGFSCAGAGYSASSRTWADKYYGPIGLPGVYHNCTRYAAYRLAKNGVHNPGHSWGDASQWDESLASFVDHTPAVGSIAQWDTEPNGHVAYVDVVTSSYIDISEDNYGSGTSARRLQRSGATFATAQFIHLKDQRAPHPIAGKASASTVILDHAGRVWMFANKQSGDLYYRHTHSGDSGWDDFTQVGDYGWSTHATPAVAVDAEGRVWSFATTAAGNMYYRHTLHGASDWGGFTQVSGDWSPNAAPAVTVDTKGQVWMFATKTDGNMYYRHTTNGPANWGDMTPVGDGGWSATASAEPVVDGDGQVWMFVVKTGGTMYYRHTAAGGQGPWTAFVQVGNKNSWAY